jgi:hypothetical protein
MLEGTASAGVYHPRAPGSTWVGRLVRELAVQEWVVFAYLVTLIAAVSFSPKSPDQARCLGHVVPLLAFYVAVIIPMRGGLFRGHFWAPIFHRLAVYGMVQTSYFELRELLPIVNTTSLDAELSLIDQRVLHFEPSLFLDRFVSSATTEWFAFFYFGYFALLASHVLPMVFGSRRTALLGEFSLGMILVYAVAHTVYMIVPGYGPFRYLAGLYQHDLPRGMWLDMVLNAVQSGGAQKDIFPSLHTAGPLFLSIFSFRHRDKVPFKYTWPFVAFFSANIVIATMFLRWHYLIDVLAGIALAAAGSWIAARVNQWEAAHRDKNGHSPVWTAITLRPSPPPERA